MILLYRIYYILWSVNTFNPIFALRAPHKRWQTKVYQENIETFLVLFLEKHINVQGCKKILLQKISAIENIPTFLSSLRKDLITKILSYIINRFEMLIVFVYFSYQYFFSKMCHAKNLLADHRINRCSLIYRLYSAFIHTVCMYI